MRSGKLCIYSQLSKESYLASMIPKRNRQKDRPLDTANPSCLRRTNTPPAPHPRHKWPCPAPWHRPPTSIPPSTKYCTDILSLVPAASLKWIATDQAVPQCPRMRRASPSTSTTRPRPTRCRPFARSCTPASMRSSRKTSGRKD